ncbi:putative phosphodiesterase [Hydrogenophaga palleronii]|uniref:Phosphodiesterase n=1 Tax=Hydrogenophaga palleronii TaxID=65655 RepID=A0ABU1WRU8_9BURK|nr:metallophosphoesterase [Hydrogenophaga palleronii]MDR7152016.1 putative phosphodiesterase [Hydrogenophaga palleronii]
MKLLILSDLHLDFAKFSPVHNNRRIDDGVDLVVLAGDIAEGDSGIRWARETFVTKEIAYVAGNHEYYEWHLENHLERMRSTAKRMGVHFLERDTLELGGCRFLGTTLWTDFEFFGAHKREEAIAEAELYMNDYSEILTSVDLETGGRLSMARKARAVDTTRLHQESVAWLDSQLSAGDPSKTVVITHHAPHKNSVHPRYADDLLTAAYASDLSHLVGRNPLWIHGHMHDSSDYQVDGTRVVCNARGYMHKDGSPENRMFNPRGVIEV